MSKNKIQYWLSYYKAAFQEISRFQTLINNLKAVTKYFIPNPVFLLKSTKPWNGQLPLGYKPVCIEYIKFVMSFVVNAGTLERPSQYNTNFE